MFGYVGELCRYLMNVPASEEDQNHHLRVISGNGLRPDIWEKFQTRFKIPKIRELYGATEGVGALVNTHGRPGMVGRYMRGSLVATRFRDGKGIHGRSDDRRHKAAAARWRPLRAARVRAGGGAPPHPPGRGPAESHSRSDKPLRNARDTRR